MTDIVDYIFTLVPSSEQPTAQPHVSLHSHVSYVEGEKSLTRTTRPALETNKTMSPRQPLHTHWTWPIEWNKTKTRPHALWLCIGDHPAYHSDLVFKQNLACLTFWSQWGTPYERVFGSQHCRKFGVGVFLFSSFKNPVILYPWCSLKLCLSVVRYCYCFGLSNGYRPRGGPTRAVIQHRKLISTRDSLWIFSY